MKLPGYKRAQIAPGVVKFERKPAGRETYSTFETEQPWVVYHWGSTHDGLWPPWRSTRVLGRMRIICECAICGRQQTLTLRIPRFGAVAAGGGHPSGKHPARLRFLLDHVHAERGHPMSWAKPLLNPDAHRGGLDLDLLAARLEADLRDAA